VQVDFVQPHHATALLSQAKLDQQDSEIPIIGLSSQVH
jgi:hypothetical protein